MAKKKGTRNQKIKERLAKLKREAAEGNKKSPYHKGGIVHTQYNKFPQRDLAGLERRNIYRVKGKNLRSISKEMAAIYGAH